MARRLASRGRRPGRSSFGTQAGRLALAVAMTPGGSDAFAVYKD